MGHCYPVYPEDRGGVRPHLELRYCKYLLLPWFLFRAHLKFNYTPPRAPESPAKPYEAQRQRIDFLWQGDV